MVKQSYQVRVEIRDSQETSYEFLTDDQAAAEARFQRVLESWRRETSDIQIPKGRCGVNMAFAVIHGQMHILTLTEHAVPVSSSAPCARCRRSAVAPVRIGPSGLCDDCFEGRKTRCERNGCPEMLTLPGLCQQHQRAAERDENKPSRQRLPLVPGRLVG